MFPLASAPGIRGREERSSLLAWRTGKVFDASVEAGEIPLMISY